jgi:protein tyrosine/serine phosphatase
VFEISLRNKVVAYFRSQPKVEIAICRALNELDKHYLGSEITHISETILYEKDPAKYGIEKYLQEIVLEHQKNGIDPLSAGNIDSLVQKFLYEFESCSSMQRRSDGYQFYFFYNIALQVAVQLNQLSKGCGEFNFLPKYFIANTLRKEEQDPFYLLNGTLFLPEANRQKRRLLEFFYAAIEKMVSEAKLNEVKGFCEWIYNRDFFWNFRDVSVHNPRMKSGILYRTATLTYFQDEPKFSGLLNQACFKTVIDLRADKEVHESSYSDASLQKFKYVRTPLDSWNQPDWFKRDHHQGTNEEIAYRFFAIGCRVEIKTAIEAILAEKDGSVAIHCFAGKDRTGIFISLLHLLIETPIEFIQADYLASEVDVKLHRLDLVLDIVHEKGGIESYLLWCGLLLTQISELRMRLLK